MASPCYTQDFVNNGKPCVWYNSPGNVSDSDINSLEYTRLLRLPEPL